METKLSPFYELLVTLEDSQSLGLVEVRGLGETVARGAIGKMDAMKLLKKIVVEGETRYLLSSAGYDFLNSILDVLHRGTLHWDGKWRIVNFSLNEKNRSARDKFRRLLEAIGFRPVLNGTWISPNDTRDEVQRIARDLGLHDSYAFFETEAVIGLSNEKIVSSWDFENTRDKYENFIEVVEKLLSSRPVKILEAKKMIFLYSLILNSEPRLPIEFLPKDWPKFRAHLSYKKLKRLISG